MKKAFPLPTTLKLTMLYDPLSLLVVLVMLTELTEVAIRPLLEMTWPSLDQVKLVGIGLASNPREKVKSSPSSTVVGWFGRMLYTGGSEVLKGNDNHSVYTYVCSCLLKLQPGWHNYTIMPTKGFKTTSQLPIH